MNKEIKEFLNEIILDIEKAGRIMDFSCIEEDAAFKITSPIKNKQKRERAKRDLIRIFEMGSKIEMDINILVKKIECLRDSDKIPEFNVIKYE